MTYTNQWFYERCKEMIQERHDTIDNKREEISKLQKEIKFLSEVMQEKCEHKNMKQIGNPNAHHEPASFMNEGGPIAWKDCMDCGFKTDLR